MSKPYRRDDLAEQLNTTFQMHFAPDVVMDAQLINVSEIQEMGSYESFTTTFLVAEDCPIQQQIYKIGHEKMGEMELFLVPSGKDERGTTYVSVFTYSKE